jgi:predicted RNA-binding protein YlqC (UPF0109 family)
MDNLKRIGDADQEAGAKRFRPEDGSQLMNTGGSQAPIAYDCHSRMLLNKVDFGRVVGKGGQMISNIRAACGATVKGVDVTEDLRLVTISGAFRQVMDAFEMISELLCNMANVGNGIFAVDLAVDHSKTGRVVGAKGAMLASIKSKSGTNNITVSKDPQEMQPGLMLRIIRLEGSLQAIRRAHFHILELFYFQAAPGGQGQGQGQGGAGAMTAVQNNMGNFGISSSYGPSAAPPPMPSAGGVPLSMLAARGVHQDVVKQLCEIDAYINQYGLEVSICEKNTAANQYVQSGASRYAVSTDRTPHAAPTDTRKHSVFEIPSEAAGGIIGKGGSILRELQQEFGCRVRLETLDKTDVSNTRKVLVWHDDEDVHRAVRERIEHMVGAMEMEAGMGQGQQMAADPAAGSGAADNSAHDLPGDNDEM